MFKRFLLLTWLVLDLVLLIPFSTANAKPSSSAEGLPTVLVLTADAPVAPSMVEYITRGIHTAEQRGADLLILQLNTPGGAVDSMTRITTEIRASRVPIVVYVAPSGGMAASAGTMITLAAHAAAMAPLTTIGAASPVGSQGEDLGDTLSAKLKEDMKANVRNFAAHRRPEAIAFAEQTIDEAKAATAQEALNVGLIDFIATDLKDLLRQLDGFTVIMNTGAVTLHPAQAIVEMLPISLIEQLLQTLANPNIVFLLIAVGVQAILIELSSPGGWVAGFVGVVCLALATYGMGILPVNWFGLIFMATAFALFVLDIKAPTHGALTAAGVTSLVIGALVLFNSPGTPSFQKVSVPLVIAMSLVTAAIFLVILSFGVRAQKVPIQTGQDVMIGRTGMTRSELAPHGHVQIAGELWSAHVAEGEPPIPASTRVVVIRVDGIRLVVKPVGSS